MQSSKTEQTPDFAARNEAVVTGYGVRLPQASTGEEFWQVLIGQQCVITEIGPDRFAKEKFFHPDPMARGKTYSVAAGQLENIWEFDAAHFGISPREAAQMDPQQRLLLTVTAEALADAGLTADTWDKTRTGVYVGASSSDFSTGYAGDPDAIDAQFMVGNTLSVISNRLAYVFDIKGPSYTVDTACSSSFYAINQAVEALRNGRIDTAIVGAVNLLISPIPFVGFSRAAMLSPDGLCKAFDAEANGYVRSEGAVVFVLRRKDIARRHKDKIRAVIHATGVNSNGRTVGLSMPSLVRQQDLLSEIRKSNPFDLNDLAFLEAHGTGTAVGDPIEANAIGNAFATGRREALPIGSAKSNFGHLEPASGLVGMLKSVLALEKGIYPASLHISEPNPNIDFDALNILVATKPIPLPERDRPWLAAINSFGFGGANAHVVLRQPWGQEISVMPDIAPRNRNLSLSATSEKGLAALAQKYVDEVLDGPGAPFCINNSNYRRDPFAHRLVAIGETPEKIKTGLAQFSNTGASPNVIVGKTSGLKGKVGFVFSGNGAHWPGMGRYLYLQDPEFSEIFNRVSVIYGKNGDVDLAALLLDREFECGLADSPLAQPLAFAIQIALTDCLRKRGLNPSATAGHSAGAVPAAYAAGILSLRSAVELVRTRSEALREIYGKGGMAAVLAGAVDLANALDDFGDQDIVMSAENSSRSTTISGPAGALGEFAKFAKQRRLAVKILNIAYPFHSPAVECIKDRLLHDLAALAPQNGTCQYYSSTLGRQADGPELGAEYWWRNARDPVLFRQAIATMVADGCDRIIEIGPKSILKNYVIDSVENGQNIGYVSSLGPDKKTTTDIATIAAKAWVMGAHVNPMQFHGPRSGYFANLPSIQWQYQNFPGDRSNAAVDIYARQSGDGLVGHRLRHDEAIWHNRIDPVNMPWLKDHCIDGSNIFPATGFVDMALSAGRAEFGHSRLEISDLEFLRPVIFADNCAVDFRTSLDKSSSYFCIETRSHTSNSGWEIGCFGTLRVNPATEVQPCPTISGQVKTDIYQDLSDAGFEYGPEFSLVRKVTLNNEIAEVLFDQPEHRYEFLLDPRIADAALHGLFPLVTATVGKSAGDGSIMIPSSFGRVQTFDAGAQICRARVQLKTLTQHGLSAEILLCDAAGVVCAQFSEVRLRALRMADTTMDLPVWEQNLCALSKAGLRPDIQKLAKDAGLIDLRYELNDTAILIDTAARTIAQAAMHGLAKNGIFDLSKLLDNTGAALAQTCLELLAEDDLAKIIGDQIWQVNPPETLPEFPVLLDAILKTAPEYAVEIQELLRLQAHLEQAVIGGVSAEEKKEYCVGQSANWQWRAVHKLMQSVMLEWPQEKRLNILVVGQIDSHFYRYVADNSALSHLVISDCDEKNVPRLRQQRDPTPKAEFRTLPALKAQDKFDYIISVKGMIDAKPEHFSRLNELLIPDGSLILTKETPDALQTLRAAMALEYWDQKTVNSRQALPKSVLGGTLTDKLHRGGFVGINSQKTTCNIAEIDLVFSTTIGKKPAIQSPAPNWKIWNSDCQVSNPEPQLAQEGQSFLFNANLENGQDGTQWHIELLNKVKEICQLKPQNLLIVAPQEDTQYSGIVGVFRVLVNEFQTIKIRLVEHSGKLALADAINLVNAFPEEPHIVWNGENAHAPRIVQGRPISKKPDDGDGRILAFDQQGRFDTLSWHNHARRKPELSEVEIRVLATGLNFRDVMWAQGVLPAEALEGGFSGAGLGMECAGVVERAGANSGFSVGDRVLAFAPQAFSSHVTVDSTVVGRVPPDMKIEIAASLPVAFLTAFYGLKELANLQPNETVLIHGGAGGVGLAALQIAHNIGAQVIATAGTSEKRQMLRDLGAKWVLESRSLGFEQEIHDLTGGVDVVLNMLAGEAMERSIACLKPFGRFVELGKRDFFANSKIGLKPFRKNLSYFGMDADQLLQTKPEVVSRIFASLQREFKQGSLLPPPCRIFEAEQVGDAFRLMQKSGHIGKIIVRPPEAAPHPVAKSFKARGAWLIIGGTGGVGLATAKMLAQQGAAKIWLIGRSGVADCSGIPAETEVVACDACDPKQMQNLFDRIAADAIPLRGVVHAAMVIDDGLLKDLTPDRVKPVLAAKIAIAELLHRHTQGVDLDHFVMFSSISTFFGNPGQSSYVAANAFLEHLVVNRRAHGEKGICIAFGPISDVGYLSRNPQTRDILVKQMGGGILGIDAAMTALANILARDQPGPVAVGPIAWAEMADDLKLLRTPYFERIQLQQRKARLGRSGNLLALIDGLKPAEALAKTLAHLRAETAEVLRQPAEDIDPDKALTDLGFDSLMAMSLRMQVEENLGISLPLMTLAEGLTLNQLAHKIANGKVDPENVTDLLVAQHVTGALVDTETVNTVAVAAKKVVGLTKRAG